MNVAPLNPQSVLVAAVLAAGIAAACAVLRLLTPAGAAAAFGVGFVVMGLGMLPFAWPLLAFFVSSTALSLIGRSRKAAANSRCEKQGPRDAAQVLANGLAPAALAALFAFRDNTREIALLYLSTLAAANADTWATEAGGLARARPRLVTTLRPVDPGTSGAVSLLGTAAALAGAALIPLVGWLAWPPRSTRLLWRIDLPEMVAVTWAGFMAAGLDSFLGASTQARYLCARCGAETERRRHCGVEGRCIRGWKWMKNDLVNLISTASAAGFAWLLLRFFAYPL